MLSGKIFVTTHKECAAKLTHTRRNQLHKTHTEVALTAQYYKMNRCAYLGIACSTSLTSKL